jgi:hypothetical protein
MRPTDAMQRLDIVGLGLPSNHSAPACELHRLAPLNLQRSYPDSAKIVASRVMTSKSNPKIEPGDEVKLRAIVTGVWDNGQFTVQIRSAGQRVTLPNDSDIEEIIKHEPVRSKKRESVA